MVPLLEVEVKVRVNPPGRLIAIHISESEVYSRILSIATSIRNQLVIRLRSGCLFASLVSSLCHSYRKVFVNPIGRLIAFHIIRLLQ